MHTKNNKVKHFCVVSHTHWDREWYQPQELMRLRLVDLVDNLLDILRDDPSYVFHLDAQTIVLEDYLAIRPYRRDELMRYISQKRLLVGPWYVQNDFYLTCGESTVRNLLIGMDLADQFGGSAKVGYAPDQFGVIGQLPQILRGFGIDNCVFGRGREKWVQGEDGKWVYHGLPAEFKWRSPDGSEVLAVHLRFWYNNAQRFYPQTDRNLERLSQIETQFADCAATPYLLLMNGVDHMEAQEDLMPILTDLNRALPAGKSIEQVNMDDYVRCVRDYVEKEGVELTTFTGEQRTGHDLSVLTGTLSSRVYIKQLNDGCEELLLGKVEPLYAMLSLAGAAGAYPKDMLHYLWKLLVQNHAHDSMCGCSVDAVHEDMENRFRRITEVSNELIRRGMETLAGHCPLPDAGEKDYQLTVFNPTERVRREVVRAEVDFYADDKVQGFSLFDGDRLVNFAVLGTRRRRLDKITPINLTQNYEVDTWTVEFVADVPAMGVRTYRVAPMETETAVTAPAALDRLENEFLAVCVTPEGRVDILDKRTGRTVEDALWLEDEAEYGSSYIHLPLEGDTPISSKGCFLGAEGTAVSPFTGELRLRWRMPLPSRVDREQKVRTGDIVDVPVEIALTLRQGDPLLYASYTVENKAGDHRLRLFLRTGVKTQDTWSLSPYEWVKRRIGETVMEGMRGPDQPNSGVILTESAAAGAALYNLGLHEYSHVCAEDGVLALTLLRADDVINVGFDGKPTGGEIWLNIIGNQCLRTLTGVFALELTAGQEDKAERLWQSKRFRQGLLCAARSCGDVHHAGDAAVQTTEMGGIFTRPDRYPSLQFAQAWSGLTVEGEGVSVSAFKEAEKGDALVLRLFNAGETDTEAVIRLGAPLRAAALADLSEQYIAPLAVEEGVVRLPVAGGRIETVLLYKAVR